MDIQDHLNVELIKRLKVDQLNLKFND